MACFTRPRVAVVLIPSLLLSLLSAAAAPAARASPGPARGSPSREITGQFIVQVRAGADPRAVGERHASRHHGTVLHLYDLALRGFAVRFPPDSAARAAAGLRGDPNVIVVEQDLEARALEQTLPTGVNRIDADTNATAKIDGVDGPACVGPACQRVPVTVAVIDTGIDLDHPDLNVNTSLSVNFASKGKNTPDDQNGHGTHVAGNVGALDNSVGVVGVAPGAELVSVRVLGPNGSGSFADVIAGIDYVTANAGTIEVANMSLGGEGVLSSLRTAIQNSINAGVVYMVAAGNDAQDVYGPDGTFGTGDDFIPAAYPEVAAISAMADSNGVAGGGGPSTSYGPDDSFASFSNFSASLVTDADNPVSPGKAIDLLLPGVGIYSTYKGDSYATLSGTSMASPHGAGLAALSIATNGRATNAAGVRAIRQALIDAGVTQNGPVGLATLNDPDGNLEKIGWAGAPNNTPAADPETVGTPEDTAAAVSLSGTDVETCELGFSIVSGPSHGALGAIAAQACTPGTPNADTAQVTYTPALNYSGADSFVYRVTDASGASADATVSITVTPVNDPPAASNSSAATTTNTAVAVSLSGTDVETCELGFTIASGPANGTLGAITAQACTPGTPNADTAQLTYTPNSGFTGTDTFTYLVNDGTASSSPATVTVTVQTPVVFSDNLEGGASGWTASGLWHLADNTSCVSPGYTSATHAFYYGKESTCNYDTGATNSGSLLSPAISGLGSSATLTFNYWRQVESYKQGAFDQTYVQVSYNGGATWTTVWYKDSKNASESAWTTASVGLTPTSSSMLMRFVFDTRDNIANTYKGWLIDDVKVVNN